jgi:hypothetical protein
MKLIRWLIAKIREYRIFFAFAGITFLILGVMFFTTDWKWIIGILTPTVLYYNYSINRMSDRRKGVLDVLSMYYTRDVLEGIQKLIKFRKSKEETSKQDTKDEVEFSFQWWVTTYFDEIEDDLDFHHQRGTVSHFWITLGTLLKHELVDPNIVYELWSQKDAEIVEEILIPVEDELSLRLYDFKLPESHPLHYIADNKDKFYKGVV